MGWPASSPSDRVAGASPLFPPLFPPWETPAPATATAASPAVEAATATAAKAAAAQAAQERFLHLLRRDPRLWGVPRTRWTLAELLPACDFLAPLTVGGLSQLLQRVGIHYKAARDYVHSPDPDYEAKLAYIDQLVAAARTAEGRLVLLYQDELTYYRQPSLARAYEARGQRQPLARRSYAANTATRAAATLDAFTGRVVPWQGTRFDIAQLVRFYQQVRAAYPEADCIYVVQDNWPVHFHPDVLVALVPQDHPWPLYRPRSWSTAPSPEAVRRWGGLHLPLQLVPLPTYASWTNPIEKLWRKGKQEVLHLHRWAEQLQVLREAFARFLAQYALGSFDLLRYVGLPVPG
jgi:hypothetical protein